MTRPFGDDPTEVYFDHCIDCGHMFDTEELTDGRCDECNADLANVTLTDIDEARRQANEEDDERAGMFDPPHSLFTLARARRDRSIRQWRGQA